MGSVKHHRGHPAQNRQRPHVYHEVVVAEAAAAFGEEDPAVAGVGDFFDGVLHVEGSYELALLHVDGAPGLGGGDQEIGLAAEKCGDLEHVDRFGDWRAIGEPGVRR